MVWAARLAAVVSGSNWVLVVHHHHRRPRRAEPVARLERQVFTGVVAHRERRTTLPSPRLPSTTGRLVGCARELPLQEPQRWRAAGRAVRCAYNRDQNGLPRVP